MRHLTLTAVFALLSVLLGVWVAQANPYEEGNPLDWAPPLPVDLALHQNLIGTVSQSGNPIDVCSDQFPTTAWMVPPIWNNPLGLTAFQWQDECNGLTDVEILTTQTLGEFQALCSATGTDHACLHPEILNLAEYNLQHSHVVMNPLGHYDQGSGQYIEWFDGNDPHTLRDVVHELGHALGLGEYYGCAPGSQLTVMDTNETCLDEGDPGYGIPQTIDVTNYHFLYHADHVQNLTAGTPSPGTVVLNWSQTIQGDPYGRSIPNEKSFGIWRGSTPVTAVPKNYQSVTLTAQPPGSQTYYVYSDSDADNLGDQAYAQVTVTVTGATPTPPPAPSTISSTFEWLSGYLVWANKLSWPSVSGADHYHICTDENRTGSYSTCYDAPGTYYHWAIPTDDDHDHYYKVKACTSSNQCSGLTTDWAQTQRSNVDGWNYVFTFYKSGSNIRFQYVNLMVYGLGLNLHIRNGSSGTSPIVSDTSGRTVTVCVANNAKSSLLTYARSNFTGTYPKVGTNGHSALAGGTCRSDSDHSQDYTLDSRWGYRP